MSPTPTTTQPTVARFQLGKKIYTTAAIDEISLRDLMLFNAQAEAMGLNTSFAEIEVSLVEISGLVEAGKTQEIAGRRDLLVVIGATVWAARRTAGEDVTLDEATNFPMKQLVFLDNPEDHQRVNPTRRPAKKAAAGRGAAASADAAQ